jgi:hypothetical protein
MQKQKNKQIDDLIKTLNFEQLLQFACTGRIVSDEEATARIMGSKKKRHEQYIKRKLLKNKDCGQ